MRIGGVTFEQPGGDEAEVLLQTRVQLALPHPVPDHGVVRVVLRRIDVGATEQPLPFGAHRGVGERRAPLELLLMPPQVYQVLFERQVLRSPGRQAGARGGA
jgi:hypothetical protein